MLIAAWLFVKPWLAGLWRILSITIPLPLFVILAAAAWAHFDKTSTVRRAVDAALKEAIAGAEIDALEARLAAEQRLRAWSDGKADEARRVADEERAARDALITELAVTDAENKELEDEIEAIKNRPQPGDGLVDQLLLDSLRNE